MKIISLLANAKINLFFSINALRPDHYCEVSTIILPVNFGDTLTLSEVESYTSTTEIKIHCHHCGFDPLNNTIRTAINLFQKVTSIENMALKIDVEKKIPIGGGFGGGSSNAVCILKALNCLYGTGLSEAAYLKIVQQIGVDCAFFVKNCPQLGMGHGDILSPLPKSFGNHLSSYFVLLFCPSFSISTPWAYEQFKKNPTFNSDVEVIIEQILSSQAFENAAYNAFQDLVLDYYPEIKKLFRVLKNHGYNPCLTGSGSGCFMLHRDRDFLEAAKLIILEHLDKVSLLTVTTFKISE